jgi:hypothetical protein
MEARTGARLAALLLGAALPGFIVGCAAGPGPSGGSAAREPGPARAPLSVTLPFTLDHNRMIVEEEFLRPDGSVRKARAWVDTGNEVLFLGEALARDLGLDISGPGNGAGGPEKPALAAPPVRLDGMPLDVAGVAAQVQRGTRVWPGVPAEANLPASLLRRHHVVFDYPARRMTVARPGLLTPRGVAIPCRVNSGTGLFMIAATADGETLHLGVDNGSAGTWVSDLLTRAWQARHPDWPRSIGAVGSANFFGFEFEPRGVLMRLPDLGLGTLRARDVALLGLDQDLFDWYSRKSAGPVAGFIGANVLRGFRLEVDFPAGMTYWEPGPPPGPGDLDIVGLTLRPEADGGWSVAGVAERGGAPAVEGVLPGDRLIRVDRLETAGASMGEVVATLRGKPGAPRSLVLEREGKRIAIEAKVVRFP